MSSNKANFFETYDAEDRRMSSDRSFGWVMAAAMTVFSAMPLRHGHPPLWRGFAAATAFAAVALIAPKVLRPLNLVWFRLGLLISPVMSFVFTSLVYFLAMTPIGLVRRLSDNDPLKLRFEPGASTYWVARNPPGPPPASMADQF